MAMKTAMTAAALAGMLAWTGVQAQGAGSGPRGEGTHSEGQSGGGMGASGSGAKGSGMEGDASTPGGTHPEAGDHDRRDEHETASKGSAVRPGGSGPVQGVAEPKRDGAGAARPPATDKAAPGGTGATTR